MVLMFCATRNLYDKIPPVLESLFQNNQDVYRVYLFIEDDYFPYVIDNRVKIMNINNFPKYIKEDTPNYNNNWSSMSLIRCYVSKILIEDKIIYADVDTIFNDGLRKLWNTPFDDNYVCAVAEKNNILIVNHSHTDSSYAFPYFNSGVLLINLKKIRDEGVDDLLIELLSQKKLKYPDQDAFNIICKNKVKYIDGRYNNSKFTVDSEYRSVIYHATPYKPWDKNYINHKLWLKYNAYTELNKI